MSGKVQEPVSALEEISRTSPLPSHLGSRSSMQAHLANVRRRLDRCWQLLCTLKDSSELELAAFQPTLAELLYDVSRDYHALAAEQRRLVRKKGSLTSAWFRKRMAALAKRQRMLAQAIAVGRSMGDAFVWYFYQDEPELLERHQKHPLQPALSGALGGLGEIALIGHTQSLVDRILLYHEITSTLRLGDFTLASLSEHQIEALGELKTVRQGNDGFAVRLTLSVAPSRKAQLNLEETMAPVTVPELGPTIRNALNRQMERLDAAISPTPKVKKEVFGGRAHAPAYASLIRGTKHRQFRCERIDDGVVVMCYRPRPSGFRLRLLNESSRPSPEQLANVAELTRDVAVADSPHNALLLSSLQYTEAGTHVTSPGMPPLFWSVPTDVARDLVFRDVELGTLVNPAHLIAKCIENGWTVSEHGDPRRVWLSRPVGQRTATIGLVYYVSLLQQWMFSEADVVDLLDFVVEGSASVIVGSGKLPLHFAHRPW